jgi:predicted ATPase
VILRRLAIFAGAFTLDSASVVAADLDIDASSVVDCVANLVEKSLLTADLSGANVHYRLLDTTRAYALQKLRENHEFEPLARRHAEYYRTLFERAEIERENDPSEWLAAYRHEIDNVRSALDWAFSRPGDPKIGVALTVAAIPLWTHLSLNRECDSRVRAALQSLDPDAPAGDRARMQLYIALACASLFTGDALPEIHTAWSNALAIAERIGDTDFQLRALWGLFTENIGAGDFRTALALSQKFASVATTSAVAADALVGERLVGYTLHFLGEQEEAQRHIARMLARYASRPSHIARFQLDQRIIACSQLSMILWLQGFPDQAMRMVEINIEDAKEGDHTRSITYALTQSACPIAIYNGDLSSADRYLRMLLERLAHHGSILWENWARCYEGVLLIKRGDLAAGTERLKIAHDDLPVNSFHMRHVAFLCELAEGQCDDGQISRALATIERALELSRSHEELWCLPELLRVRGEIALRGGVPKDAEQYFHQSLDWSHRQKVLSWELRGATSLARFWQEQGRGRDAHALLAPVYARFTEGFETSDLRSAKNLLAACSNALERRPRDVCGYNAPS